MLWGRSPPQSAYSSLYIIYLNYIFINFYLFYYRNVKNNKYSYNTKALMYEFPNAKNTERVDQIFEELKVSDEPNIKGKYQI